MTALAGASRIFAFMDEEPETDDGYVTLVNAKEENGVLSETKERTGLWAWKHPHGDGTLTYTKLEGRIVLDHVDFSYVPGKQVLTDVTLYAEPGQKVAFVGATGAGKTTITNLINRFYDIDDGKIRYDGININKIKNDLRPRSGWCFRLNQVTGTFVESGYGSPGFDETCEGCKACHATLSSYAANAMNRLKATAAGLQAAAAYFHSARRRVRPARHDTRRGDLVHRHPHRGSGSGRNG